MGKVLLIPLIGNPPRRINDASIIRRNNQFVNDLIFDLFDIIIAYHQN